MKDSDKIWLRTGSPFRELEGVRSVVLLALITIFLSACTSNQPKDNRPFVGDLDSTLIAADTVMQLGLEQSYEFNKTLTVNQNLVYDVIAWGTPSKGLICFVYRDEKGVLDSVLETQRLGIVKDCWISDLNGNGDVEVMAVLQNNDNKKLQSLTAVEVDAKRNTKDIKFEVQLPKEVISKYQGNDAIIYVAKDKALYHEFPLMDSATITGKGKIKYVLKGNKFEAVKFEETKP